MPLLLIEVQEGVFCFTLEGCFVLFFLAELLQKAKLQFQKPVRLFKLHFAVQLWWKPI